jgi:chromosome segregation ATPase
MRSSLLVTTMWTGLTVLGAVAGCDNAADEQKKANEAQATADDKARAAQADADRKIAQAQADFAKLQEDYRHAVASTLTDLDKKIRDLEAKDTTLTGTAKSDMDASLTMIHARRDQVARDLTNLQATPASVWDGARARLDKELDDLKGLVSKAPSRS